MIEHVGMWKSAAPYTPGYEYFVKRVPLLPVPLA
jgi:hypothetical protein